MLHDKMKIIGDFEPWLMPTSVQGINTCCAESVCVRWEPRENSQPGACASPHFSRDTNRSMTLPRPASSVLQGTYSRCRTAEIVL